jgi:hypothetical protein
LVVGRLIMPAHRLAECAVHSVAWRLSSLRHEQATHPALAKCEVTHAIIVFHVCIVAAAVEWQGQFLARC